MRETARLLGNTDSRTVQTKIAREGIPTMRAGKAIVINEAGLDRLRRIYAAERDRAASPN